MGVSVKEICHHNESWYSWRFFHDDSVCKIYGKHKTGLKVAQKLNEGVGQNQIFRFRPWFMEFRIRGVDLHPLIPSPPLGSGKREGGLAGWNDCALLRELGMWVVTASTLYIVLVWG